MRWQHGYWGQRNRAGIPDRKGERTGENLKGRGGHSKKEVWNGRGDCNNWKERKHKPNNGEHCTKRTGQNAHCANWVFGRRTWRQDEQKSDVKRKEKKVRNLRQGGIAAKERRGVVARVDRGGKAAQAKKRLGKEGGTSGRPQRLVNGRRQETAQKGVMEQEGRERGKKVGREKGNKDNHIEKLWGPKKNKGRGGRKEN